MTNQLPKGAIETPAQTILNEKSLGINQTYQDMTATRSYNTLYTNDTGKPIFIKVKSVYNNTGGGMQILDENDLEISAGTVVQTNTTASSTAVAIIPPGGQYKASCAKTLSSWVELR